MGDIRKVFQNCPKSPYKDERHQWHRVSGSIYPTAEYEVRKCSNCRLVILVGDVDGTAYDSIPRITEKILHEFVEVPRG